MSSPNGFTESGSFHGWDGLKLRFKAWSRTPVESGRNIVFHHGFGEHTGRYGFFTDAFASDDVNLFSYDCRGHGRSDGARGVGSITDMVRDLETFLIFLRDEFGVRKPVLVGHSMGGLVTLCFCLNFSNQWEVEGILTSGASLRVRMSPMMKIKEVSGRFLYRFAPALIMPAGLNVNLLSHDKKVVFDYVHDPLVHESVSLRLGLDIVEKGHWAIANAHRLKIPAFIGHGGADGIADPEGSRQFYAGISSEDAHLRIYRDLYHEIFNEVPAVRSAVLADYREFALHLLEAKADSIFPVEVKGV